MSSFMMFEIAGLVILVSAISSKFLYKYGVPTLIVFLAIGMFMGESGPGGIPFHDYELAREIADFCLVFLLFFGGLNTNWHHTKPVMLRGGLLATVGVMMTALIVGAFAHFGLGFTWMQGLLLGTIISSTDAASVFGILRAKKVNLKHHIAPLLEAESGSNDLLSHILVLLIVYTISHHLHGSPLTFLVEEILIGVFFGVVMGKLAVFVINRLNLNIEGLYSILTIGFVLVAFSSAQLLHGSGFVSVYLLGVILSNSKTAHKGQIIRYFDGISWLAQITVFFVLGLLMTPYKLINVAPQGIGVAIFLIFVARPLVVFSIFTLFKRPIKEQLMVSWVGFRGAAPIVFATYPLVYHLPLAQEIFAIVFFVAMISVLLQGSTFMHVARKLDLIIEDEDASLMAFVDFMDTLETPVLEVSIEDACGFAGKRIADLDLPEEILIAAIKRDDTQVTPRGNTVLLIGDILLVTSESPEALRDFRTLVLSIACETPDH